MSQFELSASIEKISIKFKGATNDVYDVIINKINNKKRIHNEGYCPSCHTVQTHTVTKHAFRKATKCPITAPPMVYKGTCVRCLVMWPVVVSLIFAMLWKYIFPAQMVPWWWVKVSEWFINPSIILN